MAGCCNSKGLFLQLVKSGECVAVGELLKQKPQLAKTTELFTNQTAFHYGALGGDVQLYMVMLSAVGVDSSSSQLEGDQREIALSYCDKTNSNGQTPLMLACDAGHVALVGLLLSMGVNVRAQDKLGGRSALHYAARKGQAACITAILSSQRQGTGDPSPYASPADVLDSFEYTPLHFALWYEHPEAVKVLLLNGASIYATNAMEDAAELPCGTAATALHMAAQRGFYEGARQILLTYEDLLQSGAGAGSADPRSLLNGAGDMPVTLATRLGHFSLIRLLHPLRPAETVFQEMEEAPQDLEEYSPSQLKAADAAKLRDKLLLELGQLQAQGTPTAADALPAGRTSRSLRLGLWDAIDAQVAPLPAGLVNAADAEGRPASAKGLGRLMGSLRSPNSNTDPALGDAGSRPPSATAGIQKLLGSLQRNASLRTASLRRKDSLQRTGSMQRGAMQNTSLQRNGSLQRSGSLQQGDDSTRPRAGAEWLAWGRKKLTGSLTRGTEPPPSTSAASIISSRPASSRSSFEPPRQLEAPNAGPDSGMPTAAELPPSPQAPQRLPSSMAREPLSRPLSRDKPGEAATAMADSKPDPVLGPPSLPSFVNSPSEQLRAPLLQRRSPGGGPPGMSKPPGFLLEPLQPQQFPRSSSVPRSSTTVPRVESFEHLSLAASSEQWEVAMAAVRSSPLTAVRWQAGAVPGAKQPPPQPTPPPPPPRPVSGGSHASSAAGSAAGSTGSSAVAGFNRMKPSPSLGDMVREAVAGEDSLTDSPQASLLKALKARAARRASADGSSILSALPPERPHSGQRPGGRGRLSADGSFFPGSHLPDRPQSGHRRTRSAHSHGPGFDWDWAAEDNSSQRVGVLVGVQVLPGMDEVPPGMAPGTDPSLLPRNLDELKAELRAARIAEKHARKSATSSNTFSTYKQKKPRKRKDGFPSHEVEVPMEEGAMVGVAVIGDDLDGPGTAGTAEGMSSPARRYESDQESGSGSEGSSYYSDDDSLFGSSGDEDGTRRRSRKHRDEPQEPEEVVSVLAAPMVGVRWQAGLQTSPEPQPVDFQTGPSILREDNLVPEKAVKEPEPPKTPEAPPKPALPPPMAYADDFVDANAVSKRRPASAGISRPGSAGGRSQPLPQRPQSATGGLHRRANTFGSSADLLGLDDDMEGGSGILVGVRLEDGLPPRVHSFSGGRPGPSTSGLTLAQQQLVAKEPSFRYMARSRTMGSELVAMSEFSFRYMARPKPAARLPTMMLPQQSPLVGVAAVSVADSPPVSPRPAASAERDALAPAEADPAPSPPTNRQLFPQLSLISAIQPSDLPSIQLAPPSATVTVPTLPFATAPALGPMPEHPLASRQAAQAVAGPPPLLDLVVLVEPVLPEPPRRLVPSPSLNRAASAPQSIVTAEPVEPSGSAGGHVRKGMAAPSQYNMDLPESFRRIIQPLILPPTPSSATSSASADDGGSSSSNPARPARSSDPGDSQRVASPAPARSPLIKPVPLSVAIPEASLGTFPTAVSEASAVPFGSPPGSPGRPQSPHIDSIRQVVQPIVQAAPPEASSPAQVQVATAAAQVPAVQPASPTQPAPSTQEEGAPPAKPVAPLGSPRHLSPAAKARAAAAQKSQDPSSPEAVPPSPSPSTPASDAVQLPQDTQQVTAPPPTAAGNGSRASSASYRPKSPASNIPQPSSTSPASPAGPRVTSASRTKAPSSIPKPAGNSLASSPQPQPQKAAIKQPESPPTGSAAKPSAPPAQPVVKAQAPSTTQAGPAAVATQRRASLSQLLAPPVHPSDSTETSPPPRPAQTSSTLDRSPAQSAQAGKVQNSTQVARSPEQAPEAPASDLISMVSAPSFSTSYPSSSGASFSGGAARLQLPKLDPLAFPRGPSSGPGQLPPLQQGRAPVNGGSVSPNRSGAVAPRDGGSPFSRGLQQLAPGPVAEAFSSPDVPGTLAAKLAAVKAADAAAANRSSAAAAANQKSSSPPPPATRTMQPTPAGPMQPVGVTIADIAKIIKAHPALGEDSSGSLTDSEQLLLMPPAPQPEPRSPSPWRRQAGRSAAAGDKSAASPPLSPSRARVVDVRSWVRLALNKARPAKAATPTAPLAINPLAAASPAIAIAESTENNLQPPIPQVQQPAGPLAEAVESPAGEWFAIGSRPATPAAVQWWSNPEFHHLDARPIGEGLEAQVLAGTVNGRDGNGALALVQRSSPRSLQAGLLVTDLEGNGHESHHDPDGNPWLYTDLSFGKNNHQAWDQAPGSMQSAIKASPPRSFTALHSFLAGMSHRRQAAAVAVAESREGRAASAMATPAQAAVAEATAPRLPAPPLVEESLGDIPALATISEPNLVALLPEPGQRGPSWRLPPLQGRREPPDSAMPGDGSAAMMWSTWQGGEVISLPKSPSSRKAASSRGSTPKGADSREAHMLARLLRLLAGAGPNACLCASDTFLYRDNLLCPLHGRTPPKSPPQQPNTGKARPEPLKRVQTPQVITDAIKLLEEVQTEGAAGWKLEGICSLCHQPGLVPAQAAPCNHSMCVLCWRELLLTADHRGPTCPFCSHMVTGFKGALGSMPQ